MRFDFDSETDSIPTPSTTVQTSIHRHRQPSTITIDIPLEGSGSSRDEAYVDFQEEIKSFKEVAEALGDKISASKIGMPVECQEEVERAFRSSTLHRVIATATMSIEVTTGLGDVLAELLLRKIEFSTPNFEYPKAADVSPEDYEEVCARARAIAEASARGSGCTVGRVLKIDFPSARGGKAIFRPLRDTALFSQTDFMRMDSFSPAHDSKLLDLLSTDVPTYEDEFVVAITFELV
jgi:hypothetical protein